MAKERQTATLAGGCFWCLEAIYDRVKGVTSVEAGYSGGHVPNPSYQAVKLGTTGHAEVVHITFNADIITYKDILNIFFTIHDPTSLNQQGADVGTQYRSAIFYHDETQRKTAEEVIGEISEAAIWGDPIVTEVAPLEAFYVAEDYHQEYYARNPDQPYCRVVIEPKVVKFRQRFAEMLE